MLQVLQNLKNGQITVASLPQPQVRENHLLIASEHSLISKGTEKMVLEFGKANYLNKARQQPDKVKMALNKIRTDGVVPTIETIINKLNQSLPLGYSNVGRIMEVGSGVTDFSTGDRVLSNGYHAEVVCVPKNLCARIPDTVPSEVAAFGVPGAIGLHGVRLAKPTLGEKFVVTGLGLIGLLVAQILRANGCEVLGLDIDSAKLNMAGQMGFLTLDSQSPNILREVDHFSNGRGVDGVIVTAATNSHKPLLQAAEICRKKGRIVLIGVTGMELSRPLFFRKELSFQVSCSYGPGRYDPFYEEQGHDYPFSYVRWTEQRNFEAILNLMSSGAIDAKPLISHRFRVDDSPKAYEVIFNNQSALGVVLSYPESKETIKKSVFKNPDYKAENQKKTKVSFLGAGQYASGVLMPAFKKAGVSFHAVVTARGLGSYKAAEKFNFKQTLSKTDDIFRGDSSIIVIVTRHNTHGEYTLKSLKEGKDVFVEKPLAINMNEINRIEEFYKSGRTAPQIMVGFNRRFSPLVQEVIPSLRKSNSPKIISMKINAGQIPPDHWVQDIHLGGRRLIGEGCHFIDLARYLVGHEIVHFNASSSLPKTRDYNKEDQWSLNLKFRDGSLANIFYFSNGHKSLPKEDIEVHCDGMSFKIDNFRTLKSFGWKGIPNMKLWLQDKGQFSCVSCFINSVQKGHWTIPLNELLEVAGISIKASEELGK